MTVNPNKYGLTQKEIGITIGTTVPAIFAGYFISRGIYGKKVTPERYIFASIFYMAINVIILGSVIERILAERRKEEASVISAAA